MNRSFRRGVGRLALSTLVLFLVSSLATATTAVPQWQQIFHPAANGTTSSAPLAARELADGTVLVVTQTLQTLHYSHDGTILSAKQLNLTPPSNVSDPNNRRLVDRPDAGPSGAVNAHAAIDAFGRAVVSVVAATNAVPHDTGIIETLKFDGLTGDRLWPAPMFYNANLGEKPTAVLLDSSGDVIVTAVAPGNQKHATLKYDGRNGAVLWGPMIIDDVTFPVASSTASLDLLGNVYVSVPINFPQSGIATRKYSGADGSTLWGPVVFADPNALPGASVVGLDGGYVVSSGSDDEFVTLKYNVDSGALIWGPSRASVPPGSSEVSAQSLTVDADGDLFWSGRYDPPGSGPKLISQKLAGDAGAPLWTGAPIDTIPGYQPVQTALAANGDLIVGGVLGTQQDPLLNFWRYRGSDGTLLWGPSAFGPIGLFDPPTFFVGSNGRIFTSELAPSQTATAALSSGEIDASTGVAAWGPTEATFPRVLVIRLADLAAGPDGNPVVSGNSFGSISTLKYDRATGAVVWGPVVYAPADTSVSVTQLAVDTANDVFLLGFTEGLVPPFAFGAFVLKYSGATGAVLWGPTVLDGLGQPIGIALDSAGNALVAAWKPDDQFLLTHSAVAKISGATGSVAWGPVVFDSGSAGPDYSTALALDASGNAFVVGDSTTTFGTEWFALKYSGSDGSLLWGPSSGTMGQPYAAATDASGNLTASGNDEFGTMTTVQYAASTGSVVWGPMKVPGGPGGAVAIAGNGDVAAAGENVASFDAVDFVTIRYKGSDGSVVWGPVLTDGGSIDIPYARGLAFDAGGNVVLGGYSKAVSGLFDISLVKYAGATGAMLWGPVRVGGPEDERLTGFNVRGNSIAVGGTSEAGMLTAVLDESLGIQTAIPSLPPAFCGIPYSFPFVAQNGTPAYTWSIVSGSLPDGLTLSSAGILSGTATEQGTFSFRVHVGDSAAGIAERDFSLVVTEDPGGVAILAFPGAPCHWTLAVPPGSWTSYLWLPDGQTTPTIDVSPVETTTYGVVVGDGSGCLLHLSVTLPGTVLQNPSCLGPSIASISPSSGPASGGTAVTIAGGNFQPGAELAIGGLAVGATVVGPAQITAATPALPPGTLNDVVVQNPDSGNAALLKGFFADFLDVPSSNIFHDVVETLFRRGVTAGCAAGAYCPDAHTTRAQMAVFLLKSLLGAGYVPPPATGAIFIDVFPGVFAADWIEDLYNRGITGGCIASPLAYCPDADVTRAEMAVFLLKTLLGTGYDPPGATGTIFADVPANAFAAAWIEDLYRRGITAGCQTSPLRYCPDAPVRRDEMAAFLVLTFGL